MTDRELMQQALEALEASMPVVISPKAHEDLCTALRERLARPARGPLTQQMVKAADELGLGYTERGYFNDGWVAAEAAHGIGEKK